jgi:hypothetical protein
MAGRCSQNNVEVQDPAACPAPESGRGTTKRKTNFTIPSQVRWQGCCRRFRANGGCAGRVSVRTGKDPRKVGTPLRGKGFGMNKKFYIYRRQELELTEYRRVPIIVCTSSSYSGLLNKPETYGLLLMAGLRGKKSPKRGLRYPRVCKTNPGTRADYTDGAKIYICYWRCCFLTR